MKYFKTKLKIFGFTYASLFLVLIFWSTYQYAEVSISLLFTLNILDRVLDCVTCSFVLVLSVCWDFHVKFIVYSIVCLFLVRYELFCSTISAILVLELSPSWLSCLRALTQIYLWLHIIYLRPLVRTSGCSQLLLGLRRAPPHSLEGSERTTTTILVLHTTQVFEIQLAIM